MQRAIGLMSSCRLLVLITSLLALLACVDTASVAHLRNEVRTDIGSHEFRVSEHAQHRSFPWSWFGQADSERPKIMSDINQFRAKICYDMKTAHGKKFDSFASCKEFMMDACKPGGDLNMDGDKGERSSGHGYCKAYFSKKAEDMEKNLKEAEKKDEKLQAQKLEGDAEEVVEDSKGQEVVEDSKGSNAESGGAKEAGAAGESGDKTGEDAVGQQGAAAPAPATAPSGAPPSGKSSGKSGSAPAPAAAGGPAGAPSAGGKFPGDEAWYYKNGGKDAGRFHMNEKLKLPTQGYHGPLVEHEDMKTGTSDWRAEFGDNDGTTLADVCRRHPESRWCYKKADHSLEHFGHSGSLASAPFPLIMLIAVISAIM